jgi:hypothetical protein
VYNQQPQARPVNVRLPVGLPPGVASFSVLGATAQPLPAQLLPASPADLALRSGYYGYGRCSDLPGSWAAGPGGRRGGGALALRWRGAGFPAGAFTAQWLGAPGAGWQLAHGQLAPDGRSATLALDSGAPVSGW